MKNDESIWHIIYAEATQVTFGDLGFAAVFMVGFIALLIVS